KRRGSRPAPGGLTSATGFPNRVMTTRVPVLRTLSMTARQVALNLETAISSMAVTPIFINRIAHGPTIVQPWSDCVRVGPAIGHIAADGESSQSPVLVDLSEVSWGSMAGAASPLT